MNYSLISSFFITGLSLFALKPMAEKIGLLDFPGGRKTHSSATPMVGGLGIYFGTFCMCLFNSSVLADYTPLLAISAFVLVVGLFDDAKDLNVSLRLSLHTLAALAMALLAGVKLSTLGDLFFLGSIDLGIFSIPLTVIATVGVINAINMSDGIDGLSGSMVTCSLIMLAIVSFASGSATDLSFIIVLACSVLAFLTLNFRRPWKKRALIYLGDAGSTMLGFMLAWLLIDTTQGENAVLPPVYALWFLSIPLFDTVHLLVKRPLKGDSPFAPGTDHLHHNLLKIGFSVEQVVVTLVAASALLGTFGLVGFYSGASEAFMFLSFILFFLVYCYFSDRLTKNVTA